MAIRRYTKASDNSPAWGYAVIEDIQGTGDFKMPLAWTRAPQDGIVSFAQSFNLPNEFIPIQDTVLRRLDRAGGSGTLNYDINTDVASPAASTISDLECCTVVHSTSEDLVQPSAWYLYSATPGSDGTQVRFLSQQVTDVASHFAIVHADLPIMGRLSYFGSGTDVSATYGLAARTRYAFATAFQFPADPDNPGHPGLYDNVAEMVWVNGVQIVGDTYSHYYSYGGGSYDLFPMPDGTVEIQFVTPLEATDVLRVALFNRWPQPMINIRYEDPFDEDGVWIQYWNIPKGDLLISYYVM